MNINRLLKTVMTLPIRIVGAVMLIAEISILAVAQEPIVREQTVGNIISFEQMSFQHDSSYRIIIPVRIRYDFFVFVKPALQTSSTFTASGEISAELLDSTGTSVAQKIERINLSITDNTPGELRLHFHQNFISFTVPNGRYTIVFTLEDKESKRRFTDSQKTFVTSQSNTNISGLIPAIQTSDSSFSVFNLSGDVQFSHNYGFLFQTTSRYSSASYSLHKILPDEDDNEVIASNVPVSLVSFAQASCSATLANNTVELYLDKTTIATIHYVAFDGSQLRQGRYELVLTFPDSSTVKTIFGARWLDMPVALNDLDIAIEPLQFITTKDDYSNLRRGSRDSRIKKFEEFWKKKDSTPSTAYNEVMHEFYRRVDFSVIAFRTLREMNGAITDRGKIYILYGNPTTTERLLAPDGAPKEIWKYNSQNKIFTFEDPGKQGNYKLTEH